LRKGHQLTACAGGSRAIILCFRAADSDGCAQARVRVRAHTGVCIGSYGLALTIYKWHKWASPV
jgi:hypothetical protein